MIKVSRFVFLCSLLLALAILLPADSSAQGLCSGRCLIDPETGNPDCSLSLYGRWICHEGQDYCAEFECPEWGAVGPDSAPATDHFQPAGQCQLAFFAEPQRPPGEVQVIKLKSRT